MEMSPKTITGGKLVPKTGQQITGTPTGKGKGKIENQTPSKKGKVRGGSPKKLKKKKGGKTGTWGPKLKRNTKGDKGAITVYKRKGGPGGRENFHSGEPKPTREMCGEQKHKKKQDRHRRKVEKKAEIAKKVALKKRLEKSGKAGKNTRGFQAKPGIQ